MGLATSNLQFLYRTKQKSPLPNLDVGGRRSAFWRLNLSWGCFIEKGETQKGWYFGFPPTVSVLADNVSPHCHPGRHANHSNQCSFVYPYPSVSDLAGGNPDQGPSKIRTKTQTTPDSVFSKERRNSDHSLSFWGGKLRPWSEFGAFLGWGEKRGLSSI